MSEENGWVALQQGVGRLINAIVAVLGPELAPGSIFFSRCKVLFLEAFRCHWACVLMLICCIILGIDFQDILIKFLGFFLKLSRITIFSFHLYNS